MVEVSDERLVRDVQEGDIFAFELLVKRYQHRLHSFVTRVVRDSDEAWDIVQESFINLYKTIDRVDTDRKFSTYIFSVARNGAFSHLRGRKKEIPLEETILIEDDEVVYERLAREDMRKNVHKAMQQLDRKYRGVLELYYFDDLSYEEIATKLRIPVNTVRTHLSRGKAGLKKILTQS